MYLIIIVILVTPTEIINIYKKSGSIFVGDQYDGQW